MAVDTKKTEAPKGEESQTYAFVTVCKCGDLPEGEVQQLKARIKRSPVDRLVGGSSFRLAGVARLPKTLMTRLPGHPLFQEEGPASNAEPSSSSWAGVPSYLLGWWFARTE